MSNGGGCGIGGLAFSQKYVDFHDFSLRSNTTERMALDPSMIHKARALFRQITADEEYLYKQRLIDLFLHDPPTQQSLQHISSFLFHAINTEGTFETALNRMKTKVTGKLNMDEFMAFLNSAAINMVKGHTPNTADLHTLRQRRPDQEEAHQPQEREQEQDQPQHPGIMNETNSTIIHQHQTNPTKMMSSMELRSLLRPKSSAKNRPSTALHRAPKYLTQLRKNKQTLPVNAFKRQH